MVFNLLDVMDFINHFLYACIHVHRFVVGAAEFPELFLTRAGPNEAFGVHFESGKYVLPADDESEESSAEPGDDKDAVPIGEDKDEPDEAEEILNGDQVVGVESTDSQQDEVARIAYKSFDGISNNYLCCCVSYLGKWRCSHFDYPSRGGLFDAEFVKQENPLKSLKGISRKIAFPVLSKLHFFFNYIENIGQQLLLQINFWLEQSIDMSTGLTDRISRHETSRSTIHLKQYSDCLAQLHACLDRGKRWT